VGYTGGGGKWAVGEKLNNYKHLFISIIFALISIPLLAVSVWIGWRIFLFIIKPLDDSGASAVEQGMGFLFGSFYGCIALMGAIGLGGASIYYANRYFKNQ